MGFGKKTDYAQNKTFDLDKSYQYIIKPAVEKAGFTCFRADEIQHAGNINAPMYERLFEADLVVADLSTANLNAFFELGVRYALKPRTTICIAEKGFKIPFDMGQVAIRSYEHLGEGIDYGAYDFGSIMHYPSNAFAINTAIATITPLQPLPAGVTMGQRSALSTGDEASVRSRYCSGTGWYGPGTMEIDNEGGPEAFTMYMPPYCSWTVSESATWLTINSALSGTGTVTVNFTQQ